MTTPLEAGAPAAPSPASEATPAGWRLFLPLANLRGPERAKAGAWAAAIPDKAAARKAIPYGASVPSAPLQPLTGADLERLGVPPGGVKQI
jgi:hypothetical protein